MRFFNKFFKKKIEKADVCNFDYTLEKIVDRKVLEKIDVEYVNRILARYIKDNSLHPSFFLYQLADYLMNIGFQDEASAVFEKSLSLKHDDNAAILYLQNLMYTSPEKYSHKKILNITKKTIKKITSDTSGFKPLKKFKNSKNSDRILNIGYTCHFFDNSTGTSLFLPILKNHDKKRVKIFVYSDQPEDLTKQTTKDLADVWRHTERMNSEEFYNTVTEDEIDILLELNGFCLKNRYKEISLRCAPVQVSYYNLSATSGVNGIDYLLVGEEVKSEHLKDFYSEEFFRKKGIQLATKVGGHFPEPSKEPPFKKNNYITFGSFGQAHKVSRKQIFLWAEILKRVPNSKFFFKASVLNRIECLNVFKKHFEDAGIDLSRIIFEGNSPYDELLKLYEKVDIALDTYPYGGGTTTIEALIQGVPVIALNGERFCSQHGYINLYSVNHTELVCYSEDEFIKKAVILSNDKERLENYRKTLRQDVLSSQRVDIKKYVSELEDAYFKMYKDCVMEL